MAYSEQRARRIARGQEVLGYKQVGSASTMEQMNLYSFIYKAEKPGKKHSNVFDANPQIALLSVKRSKSKDLYFIGANTHYWNGFTERSSGILRMQAGLKLPSRLLVSSIHAYRVDRIKSPIYEAIEVAVDPLILTGKPVWERVKKLGLF